MSDFSGAMELIIDAESHGMDVTWTPTVIYIVTERDNDGKPKKAVAIGPVRAPVPNRATSIDGHVFESTDEIREYLGLPKSRG